MSGQFMSEEGSTELRGSEVLKDSVTGAIINEHLTLHVCYSFTLLSHRGVKSHGDDAQPLEKHSCLEPDLFTTEQQCYKHKSVCGRFTTLRKSDANRCCRSVNVGFSSFCFVLFFLFSLK